MKKSVVLISLLSVIGFILLFSDTGITGLQLLNLPAPPPIPGAEVEESVVLDLPSPPPIPGSETSQTTTNTEEADWVDDTTEDTTVDETTVEEQYPASYEETPPEPPAVGVAETVETAVPDSNVVARLDSLDSRVTAMRADVDNLKFSANRPYVDSPTLTTAVNAASKRNTILSLLLSLFLLVIIIGVVVMIFVERYNEYVADKKILTQYIDNYSHAGYKLDTLRMHLRASGWKDSFIEEVINTRK